ncbi:MAG: hypothetical protein JSS96_15380 [Bacteroidetes bacterium]|nr:hypothetical protein [Bacteroidota bacterium]
MAKQHQEEKSNAYSFVLKRIDLIEKSLNIFNRKEKKIDYDFGIGIQIMPNPTDNQSFHIMSVKIFPKGQEREIIATFRLGFIFEIFDLENIAITNEIGITLPENLLNLLNAVAIGTMRGVIFSELRGTQIDDAILPVLDPSKFQREANT